jgi:hypothetical protein
MKKMLKRADGSTSQRGLWDNIRANKGSGKEPTKEMLKQEKKIKSEKKTGGLTKYQTGKFRVSGSIGTSGGKQACIGESCKGVVEGGASYGGGSNSGTNYTGKGAQGLSSKRQIDKSRIVYQTPEEKAAGQANRAKYAAEGEASKAAKKQAALTKSGKGLYSTGRSDTMDNPMGRESGVTEGLGMFKRKAKTGGKKKSDWLSESKELKFGGKSKKRMGGKNC